MSKVTLAQAQSDLARLIDEVGRGGEVVILREGKVVAKLVAASAQTRRTPGRYKGQFSVGPEFFEPLSDEDLALWGEK